MTRLATACACTALALAAACTSAFAAERLPVGGGDKVARLDSQVTFRNDSDWMINQLYFARVSSHEWGDDQLGNHSVKNGDSFTLSQIPCGSYDVKLIDEDGDSCVVNDVSLCAESHVWSIRDKDLMKCQARSKHR